MSARTAAQHDYTELAYVSADDINNIVTFRARSASKVGQYNTIKLDIVTGETLCDCRAAEFDRECWHVALVPSAWLNHEAVALARHYSDDQLRRAGQKAKRMIDAYRGRRTWRVLPADQLALLACRTVWRERWAAAIAATEGAGREAA